MFKPTNIATPDQIFATCTEIQAFLEAHYAADNPTAVVDRANALESYMALSGKYMADANYHHSELMNSIFIKAIKESQEVNMSASTLNKYIDSICKDYKYLCTWIERINRTCTHQLDMARTIISKHKEEIRQLNYSGRP